VRDRKKHHGGPDLTKIKKTKQIKRIFEVMKTRDFAKKKKSEPDLPRECKNSEKR